MSAAANFVNASVYLPHCKRTVLPWTITPIPELDYTFIDFFNSVIRPKLPSSSSCRSYELLSSHVGPGKDLLDPVDSTLLVQPVISSFGKYLKYMAAIDEDDGGSVGSQSTCSSSSSKNVFDVLMNSARQLHLQQREPSSDYWLQPISERNRKDKLYNSIVHLLTSKGLKFDHANELKSSGVACYAIYFGILMVIIMFFAPRLSPYQQCLKAS